VQEFVDDLRDDRRNADQKRSRSAKLSVHVVGHEPSYEAAYPCGDPPMIGKRFKPLSFEMLDALRGVSAAKQAFVPLGL
jgi:hypothetical protein